jgi:hypothetical protein
MPSSIFSARARISAAKAEALLKCYAEQLSPKQTAKVVGVSQNTVYAQYERIRWRLVISGYYRDGAWSADESGLAKATSKELSERRGIREETFYLHAAEAIHWAEEHPRALALKHLRKIIELSGPLDQTPVLSDAATDKLVAYIRYARTELVCARAQETAEENPDMRPYAQRAKEALDMEWRTYRAASKALERAQNRRS